ncbi:nucleoprotein TPR isoform X2 [Cryptotermes secundus]|uniref:nucleoprotein TPR isoform X2 n=1 Tax=Cryptotermes secundus TaxID=105785 RepID=UPI000CD7DE78|nr:nucleoprotein TPR isoform X2 [Cryptotermes secundus]
MASSEVDLISNVLSSDDCSKIPEDIRKKIESYVRSTAEQSVVAKALLETTKGNFEARIITVEKELSAVKEDNVTKTVKLDSAERELEELQKKAQSLQDEVEKLRNSVQRLEQENIDFRRQRDSAVDERDSLQKMVDRRNTELQHMQDDVRMLNSQLKSAIDAKCEAIAKYEGVQSLEVSLEYKEKRLNQEQDQLRKQVQNLTEDLDKHTAELMNMRREHTNKHLLLQSQLSQITEELHIANQSNEELKSTNATLVGKLETAMQKLVSQRESESKMRDTYEQELTAQTRLAQIYKGMSDDASSKSQELSNAVKELQELLQSASKQYGDLETEMKRKEMLHEAELAKKTECIALLKKELADANELLKAAKQETLDAAIESLSPSAAAASRLIKSGMTLTQIYSQYVAVSEELFSQKEETQKLNLYITTIMEEIEEKAPILKKQREDYEHALENVATLTKQIDEYIIECNKLRHEASEAQKAEAHHSRENARLKQEVVDLAKQVCFLLKEVEMARTGFSAGQSHMEESSSDITSSSQVISQALVTFGSIEELQTNNQKLLMLVRELSSKEEEAELLQAELNPEQIHDKIEQYAKRVKELEENNEQHTKMMETLLRQRDMYRTLYEQQLKGGSSPMKLPEQVSPKSYKGLSLNQGTVLQEKENVIQELKAKLNESQKAFKELKEEMVVYRTERQTNERILTEELDTMRSELRELRTNNCKLLSQAEYNEERFKILNANTGIYKSQITALEEKNKTYSSTVVKHEQTIMHLKDEALDAQAKLSKAEVSLENLKRKCQLLQETEARLLKEREVLNREKQSQGILLANLESIRTSLERSETEGKLRLEARLDESMRECGALRRRLQEEQDRFRELSSHNERQLEAAKKRQEEEARLGAQTRDDLNLVREELVKEKKMVESLTKRIKEIAAPPPSQKTPTEAEVMAKKLKEIETQLNRSQSELKLTQQQLASSKQHAKQYSEVSEGTEKQLKEVTAKFDQYKEATEKKLADCRNSEEQLKKQVADLSSQLSKLSTGTSHSTAELNDQLDKMQKELTSALSDLEQTKKDLVQARSDLVSLSGNVQAAEEKYAHEVVLHSADIQTLSSLKEKFATLSSELSELRLSKEQAENTLNELRSGWEAREEHFKKELNDTQKQVKDMDSQNALLHDQIQALSSQLAVLRASGHQTDSAVRNISSDSLNTSISEEEKKSSEQLLQIVKYLRQEKDIALSKYEVLRTENLRLKSQQEYLEKQAEDAKKSLLVEQEKMEASSVTAAKHSELLRKVETLNAITDSNRILRGERDDLQVKVRELLEQVEKLEKELGPLKESNTDLSARVESMTAENVALRGEAGRLRQRMNYLIERSSKASPEDWRRLQQEREGLVRHLSGEKEAHQKTVEENRGLRQEKIRLEEQLSALQRLQQQQAEDLRKRVDEVNTLNQTVSKLQQEFNDTKSTLLKKNEELATITEDLGAKEALLTDTKNKELQIRKIARRYKSQFEDLTKTVEEGKVAKEKEEAAVAAAAAAAAVSAQEIPPEMQEQLRDEVRREMESKLKEAESRHSAVVKELTEQVTSSRQETEILRRENDALKASMADKEERTKSLLKTARQKIMHQTEMNQTLSRQLSDLEQSKGIMQMNAMKTQYESRISHLEKENADVRAEKQQDKERLTRDVEALNQRLNQLQRQLDKQQGSKPSTSLGPVEKANIEPPTANIKPMAGPSSTQSKQQPMQQSVTVTPWPGRGETPFASIRPMSMQSRTVAVLPTSQTSSSSSNQTSSQSTQVLVPPQQQLVHTTGSASGTSAEVLPSSPTSSHTDYMPATSSAGSSVGPIRQVAVQPTQQATVTTVTVGPSPSSREEPPVSAAESTQDIETESDDMEVQQIPGASSQQQQLQQQQQQQGQQAVALVLPRVEQQTSTTQTQTQVQLIVEQSVVVASSQANSSNTVTTTRAGVKRQRDSKGDSTTRTEEKNSGSSQVKRPRAQEMFQPVPSESGVDVEYQVPTSSQRDHEDEVIVVDSEDDDDDDDGIADEGVIEEPDDGPEFEEETDNGESYEVEGYDRDEQDLTAYDEGEGPDIDEETAPDQANNEVEIMEDSNEVPNQSGSSIIGTVDNSAGQSATVPVASSAEVLHPPQQQHSEATSSGSATQPESGSISSVVMSQASPSVPTGFARGRHVPPLCRQQQHLVLQPPSYEDAGDDSIVPSTPTLFVPRRTDGFGEAVSSPQVPTGRFTFSDTNPPTARAGIAQMASEGMDDTRMDLTQLEESGTGRSVPSTPLQVSPQGELSTLEMSSEVGQSVGGSDSSEQTPPEHQVEGGPNSIPSITVTHVTEEAAATTETEEEMPPPQLADESGEPRELSEDHAAGQEDVLDLADDGGDGVSSEGEKSQAVEDIEEGREAEATVEPAMSSTSPRRVHGGTARRSGRGAFRNRSRIVMRPTPIIWNEPGSTSSRGCGMMMMRGGPGDPQRGNFQRGPQRGRRMRGKPKGNFPPYQMRF